MDKYTRYCNNDDYYKQYQSTDLIQNSMHDYNFSRNNCLKNQVNAILHIDSNYIKSNENINNYTVILEKEYMYIQSIELIRADIPNSNYIINEYNNCFYFQDSQEQLNTYCNQPYHKIILDIGDYLVDSSNPAEITIRSMLEDGLNSVNPLNTYQVSVDPNKYIFTIIQLSGSGIFNILIQEPYCGGSKDINNRTNNTGNNGNSKPLKNNICSLLGFKTTSNKTGETSYTSDYRYNLNPNRYIILRLNDYDKQFNRLDSNNDRAQNAFITIGYNQKDNNYTKDDDYGCIDSEDYIIYFNPPIPKMTKMVIQFYDSLGNPYNFRGVNHNMVFEINSLTRFTQFNKTC